MAFELFPSKRIVNIVIHDHVIRLLVVKQSTTLVVQKYHERSLTPGLIKEGKIIDRDILKLILEECIDEMGIKKQKVQFIIPDSSIVIRKTSIPGDIEDNEIVGYLFAELGSSIHLPFDEPVLDFCKLSEDEDKKEILLIATSSEIASDYSLLFEEVSLKPIAADISPLCLYRLFHHFDKTSSDQQSLLVQLDLQSITMSIFQHDLPIFMRHIPIESPIENWNNKTSNGDVELLANWTNMTEGLIEEIVKEIEHILNFYRFNIMQGKEQVSNILISGDYPYLHEVIAILKDQYEYSIETIEKFDLLSPNYNLALGLALKEVQ